MRRSRPQRKTIPSLDDIIDTIQLVRTLPWARRIDVAAIRFIVQVRSCSQLSWLRLASLYLTARLLNRARVPGAFVECGVWKGGSAAVLAFCARRAVTPRRVWLFDSFRGMPEAGPEDGPAASNLATGRFGGRLVPVGTNVGDRTDVEELLFARCHFDRRDVLLQHGWFQDTLPSARTAIGPIALLHIDADWYESTMVCLEQLYPLVVPKGFVIIDDYGYFPGCKRAVDEFLARQGVKHAMKLVDTKSLVIRKPRLTAGT